MVVIYQQLIEGCPVIARPLFRLTTGNKGPRWRGKKRRAPWKALTAADWTYECGQAFEQLKQALLDQVLLAHPDFGKPFLLSVDASCNGLGAVLSQMPDQEMTARPIAFASKSLTYAQSKYPAHRLEFFAMKWAICDKFHCWLRGHQFTVWTDNNPLTYILSKTKLDACEQRWIGKIAPFEFSIKYIPGPKNIVTDALSREPFVQPSALHHLMRVPYQMLLREAAAVCPDQVQDVFRWSSHPIDRISQTDGEAVHCQSAVISSYGALSKADVAAVLHSRKRDNDFASSQALLLPQLPQTVMPLEYSNIRPLTHERLMSEQRQYPVVRRAIFFVHRGRQPSRRERAHEPAEVLLLLMRWDKLAMRMGVLYHVTTNVVTKRKTYLYVAPSSIHAIVLNMMRLATRVNRQHYT